MKNILKNARIALIAGVFLASGSILSMKRGSNHLQIRDVNIDNPMYCIPIDQNLTQSELYKKVADKEGVGVSQIKLLLSGKLVQNNNKRVVDPEGLDIGGLRNDSVRLTLIKKSETLPKKEQVFYTADGKEQD